MARQFSQNLELCLSVYTNASEFIGPDREGPKEVLSFIKPLADAVNTTSEGIFVVVQFFQPSASSRKD